MRSALALCIALSLCNRAQSREDRAPAPQPDQFEIGRRTFWDFGPPFNYYDLFVIRPSEKGSTVERIILTPEVYECFVPAKIEVASAQIQDSPAALLGSMNPCVIPEKELNRKPKDCKHCQRFSGADVVMRVQCGKQSRLIPSHVFEDYWFNPAAKPPKATFSLLQLLKRMDDAVGPGVMEKPMFDFSPEPKSGGKPSNSDTLQRLSNGEFDGLFNHAPDKPSQLFQAAQIPPPTTTVQLLNIVPLEPVFKVMPSYPPIARSARIQDEVTFGAEINSDGAPTNTVFLSGGPLFQAAVADALKSWKFPIDINNQQIRGTIGFGLSCRTRQP